MIDMHFFFRSIYEERRNNYTLKMIELWRRLKFIDRRYWTFYLRVRELMWTQHTKRLVSMCALLYVKERNIDGIARARVQHFASSFIVYRVSCIVTNIYTCTTILYGILSLYGEFEFVPVSPYVVVYIHS